MSTEKDYVLGTHDAEIERLGLQHRVWRSRSLEAWRRAGFSTGQVLLDAGCGPGWATFDLAGIVGPTGRVVAVDRSRRFLSALEQGARAHGLRNIESLELDLDEAELPRLGADGAWSRWVYAFVRHPRRLLEQVAGALRPGGVIVIHEYADYRAWRLSTPSPAFEGFVAEVMASWRANGGEPDIGLQLPGWLEALGFKVRSLLPLIEAPRPRDFGWQWPRAFVDTGVERLVELGRVDRARADAIRGEFAAAEAQPGAFLLTPTVIEIVAYKR